MTKLVKFQQTSIYQTHDEKLRSFIDNYNKQLVQSKDKKFSCDPLAFKMGRAYRQINSELVTLCLL